MDGPFSINQHPLVDDLILDSNWRTFRSTTLYNTVSVYCWAIVCKGYTKNCFFNPRLFGEPPEYLG